MASPFLEKLQVAVITATLVSAGWIVAGAMMLDRQEAEQVHDQLAERAAPPSFEKQREGGKGKPGETEGITSPASTDTATLIVPVLGISVSELSDTFADDRGSGERLHEAIDIMAPTGTSVVAAAPGKIEKLFLSDAGGKTIYLRSGDGETIHYYAHLQDYAEGLKEGQQIRRGQRLGTVGSSGNADPASPHLHFAVMRTTQDAEWWEPSTALNPYPLLVGARQARIAQ